MVKIRNHTDQCTFNFCHKPVENENDLLCPEHKQASKDAATDLLKTERKIYGPNWPATQYESSDA